MSTYTEHYNAKKPSKSENYDIDVANFNNDLWDEKIFEKQDKIVGKALSTNDFTNQYKNKLDSLKNYDDTEIKNNIEDIQIAQIKQDSNIQYLQTQNTKLKSENERLREDIKSLPKSSTKGTVSAKRCRRWWSFAKATRRSSFCSARTKRSERCVPKKYARRRRSAWRSSPCCRLPCS